jgi:3-oxoadipate enol-lactonase
LSEVSISCSKIPYLRFGEGEPLVFIHGIGVVKEGWKSTI